MQETSHTFEVSSASEKELPQIMEEARKLDLDLVNIIPGQFMMARKGNELAAFGRLIDHDVFAEIATLGSTVAFRNQGAASDLVKALIAKNKKELFLVTVIPEYFRRFGFVEVKEYSPVFQPKIDFCKCYDFSAEEIKVMRLNRK